MVDVIMRKRDGGTLSAHDIQGVITGYVGKSIPDYQMSALLMAIMFRGLDSDETLALTTAMVNSGEVMDMSSIVPAHRRQALDRGRG